jgi:hypothetical protein
LRRFQLHCSLSLSWNGRYVAVLIQQGSRRLAVIEDRVNGNLLRFPLPSDQEVERLSLAPSGRRLALEVVHNGINRVQVFDLANQLEPDLPAGMRSGSGAPAAAGR